MHVTVYATESFVSTAATGQVRDAITTALCEMGYLVDGVEIVRPQPINANTSSISEITETVDQAIRNGQANSLDMVIRARYACQWGNGDALHRELADEVVRLRAMVHQHRLDYGHTANESGNNGKHSERS